MHYIGTTYFIKPTEANGNALNGIRLLATLMPNGFRVKWTYERLIGELVDDTASFAETDTYARIQNDYAPPHRIELPRHTPPSHEEPHISYGDIQWDGRSAFIAIHIPVTCAWASDAKELADDFDQLVLALFGDDLFCMKRKTAEPGAVFDDIPTVTTRL